MEGRLASGFEILGGLGVNSSAQLVSGAAAGFVPAPLRNVARHIVCAERAHALGLAHWPWGSRIIAQQRDVFGYLAGGGKVPLRNRRQALAGEFRVGRRLVPTHAAHRVIVLSHRKMARHPGGWPRTAGRVAEQLRGLLPAQFFAVANEFLLPVFALLVSAFVHKLLILTIGDLEAVHVELGKIVRAEVSQ